MTVETIFALSTGRLPSGVAVVRISGPHSSDVLKHMCEEIAKPRIATLSMIKDPETGDVLDQGLVLWFPAPNSFTGEDCAELHLHGSTAVVTDVLAALGRLPGFRPAEPGEFSRRAFEGGKIDLLGAEGLSDLIAAQTSLQRRQALRQVKGKLSARLDDWRRQLLQARALIEADLDFADEEDVPGSVADEVWVRVAELAQEIAGHLEESKRGERIRSGVQIVILGAPNAGKSSLLNALARRDVAIVTPEAGTTRDLLEVSLDLDGAPVTLVDTAGLRSTDNLVEAEGIRRARSRAEEADLILWLVDASDELSPSTGHSSIGSDIAGLETAADMWTVFTKSDKRAGRDGVPTAGLGAEGFEKNQCHQISVVTADGLDAFLSDLTIAAHRLCGSQEEIVITRFRHRSGLERTLQCLRAGLEEEGAPLELRSEHLRLAGEALGRITGRIDVEELLGAIFSEFCIGK